MPDEYTEVTTTSWGRRIINSFVGILIGIALFGGSFVLIFWNEDRSVSRIRALDEGRGIVVALSAERMDPAHNNALVHFSAEATTKDILKDALFGVQENALKLKRTVKMYQWKEEKHTRTHQNVGGSETKEVTYSYSKTWSEQRIDSSAFKHPQGHENPPMPYKTTVYTAPRITVGDFVLTTPFVKQMHAFESYPLSESNYQAMEKRMQQSFALNGDGYFSGDEANPAIGALSVRFSVIKPTEVSIIGKQDNHTLQPYHTKNGDLNLLSMGNVDAESMFAEAETKNTLITWAIRFGAFIMMWVGLLLVFAPIKVLGDVVPFIGGLLGAGIGLVSAVIALVLSCLAIAVAWMIYRPLIAALLLAAATIFLVGGGKLIRKRLAEA